jgi:thiamine biosynthesis protein ThiS
VKVFVNGESVETEQASDISQFAQLLALQPNSVLIEHNGCALHQREWRGRKLAEGDRIEVLRVVAGG